VDKDAASAVVACHPRTNGADLSVKNNTNTSINALPHIVVLKNTVLVGVVRFVEALYAVFILFSKLGAGGFLALILNLLSDLAALHGYATREVPKKKKTPNNKKL
jgi:hypothetical protein